MSASSGLCRNKTESFAWEKLASKRIYPCVSFSPAFHFLIIQQTQISRQTDPIHRHTQACRVPMSQPGCMHLVYQWSRRGLKRGFQWCFTKDTRGVPTGKLNVLRPPFFPLLLLQALRPAVNVSVTSQSWSLGPHQRARIKADIKAAAAAANVGWEQEMFLPGPNLVIIC